jgi:hypothetical protein
VWCVHGVFFVVCGLVCMTIHCLWFGLHAHCGTMNNDAQTRSTQMQGEYE